ncbi:MAG: carboxylesterase family protein [Flavobacteriales bacterium]|nr:carboxylesterase family protein [Flavobacteriales bacterium]
MKPIATIPLLILWLFYHGELPGKSNYQKTLEPETFYYVSSESVKLALDVYSCGNPDAPLMIFVPGGGFVGGSRRSTTYTPFYEAMASKGINVVAMDYSLPLKGQKFHCDQSAENKIMAFSSAAHDIERATQWLVANETLTQITTSNIWLCGSSAGAEAILYLLFGTEASHPEASGLNYSGFISICGASVSFENIKPGNAIPGLFIHGSCDPLVPVGTAMHHYCPDNFPGALLLHGPETLTQRYDQLGMPYQYILYCDVAHTLSNHALTLELERMAEFIFNQGKVEEQRIMIGRSDGCQFPSPERCLND